jgi:ABC-type Na+ transport system ATPase subunit NatA
MSTTQAAASGTGALDGQPGAVIHTEELTKVYPGTDFAAVDHLNLDVRAGEIFGLLGPNGAGKTTTAGMLTTRVVPTSGRALLGGVDVAAHPALAKQLSGIVSQQNTLDRQLTVWENLYFHGRLFGIGAKASRRIADELLEQFQLSRWASASVYALSGGMAQRLMVARAIFHRPSVLFLDEPTAGLDPQSRLVLWDLLGELHRDGQTILLCCLVINPLPRAVLECETWPVTERERSQRPGGAPWRAAGRRPGRQGKRARFTPPMQQRPGVLVRSPPRPRSPEWPASAGRAAGKTPCAAPPAAAPAR